MYVKLWHLLKNIFSTLKGGYKLCLEQNLKKICATLKGGVFHQLFIARNAF